MSVLSDDKIINSMIYFLYGDNDFLIDQRVNELRDDFIKKHGADCVSTIDLTKTDVDAAMARLTGISFLTPQQFIIVPAATSNTEFWTNLETNLEQIPDSTDVVMTDVRTIATVKNVSVTKTFKKLKSIGAKLEKLTVLKPYEVKRWLTAEIKRRQLQADAATIDKLITYTAGEDNQQARLSIELDKLSMIDKRLDASMVEKYVAPSLKTNAFNVLNSLLSGDSNKATKLIRELRNAGEDANRFIGLLASQEQALAVAATGANVKINSYQLRLAQDFIRQTPNIKQKLHKLARILAELDLKIKQSKPENHWLIIEASLNQL